MRYLTYEEYLDTGGVLEQTAFERAIDRVCGIIDIYTQSRLKDVAELSSRDKACVRDLCEYVHNNVSTSGKTVASKSQSAGGVSESESYTAKNRDEAEQEIYDIIYSYLAAEYTDDGVPLMYKGVWGGAGTFPTLKNITTEFDVKYGTNTIQTQVVTYRD